MLSIIALLLAILAPAPVQAQNPGFAMFMVNGGQAACWNKGSDGYTVLCSMPGTAGTCGPNGSYNGTCFVAVSTTDPNRTTGCVAQTTQAAAILAPCPTISLATQQIRKTSTPFGSPAGMSPDWIVLKAGDTFFWDGVASIKGMDFSGSGLGNGGFGLCQHRGISAVHPLVVTSYGTGTRPIIAPAQTGCCSAGYASNGGGLCGTGGDYIAFVGLEFYNWAADPNCNTAVYGNPCFDPTAASGNVAAISGFNLRIALNWMLVEDCVFSWFTGNGIDINVFLSPNFNFYFNRSIVQYAYGSSKPQGIFSAGASCALNVCPPGLGSSSTGNITIFESIFDQNGWNPSLPGQGATVFSHNLYLDTYATVTGSIIANDPAGGQSRTGGQYNYNTFMKMPYSHNFFLWQAGNPNSTSSNNVHIFQTDNNANWGGGVPSTPVVQSGDTYQETTDWIGNKTSATYANNLFLHQLTPNSNPGAIILSPGQRNSTVSNNISCDFPMGAQGPILDKSGPNGVASSGTILTYGAVTGGTGYVDGLYSFIPLTGSATGISAFAEITVSGGHVTTVYNPWSYTGTGWQGAGWIFPVTNVTGGGGTQVWTVTAPGLPIFGPACNGCSLPEPTVSVAVPQTNNGLGVPFYLQNTSPQTVAGQYTSSTSNQTTGTWNSVSTVIYAGTNAWEGGQQYKVGDSLTGTLGASGSGFSVLVASVYGGNTLTNNVYKASDCHATGWTGTQPTISDPDRTPGSYYATLPGATANATFTGTLSTGGVMTVSGWSGNPIRQGDALGGLAQSDFVKVAGSGIIATFGSLSATNCSTFPSGCSANNYIGVPFTGGTGISGTADVSVDNSTVTGFRIRSGGTGFSVGDTIGLAATTIGGSAGGASNFTTSVTAVGLGGNLSASTCSASPAGCAAGTYNNVPLTGGTGTGAQARITVDATPKVTDVTITAPGNAYRTSDVLLAAPTDIGGAGGGTVNFTFTATNAGNITAVGTPTVSTCSVSPAGCTTNNTATYNGVQLSGPGVGAKGNITVTGGKVSAVTLNAGGTSGYVLGDLMSAAPSAIGGINTTANYIGNANFTIQPATFTNSGTACNGSACTGNGGNGTYVVASGSTSGTATASYSYSQFLALAKSTLKKGSFVAANTACKLNTYLNQGFGVTYTCTP
jgi:hypothetical protein